MNAYRVIEVPPELWAVEWSVDGVRQGLVWGWFSDEIAAMGCAVDLSFMELREAEPTRGDGG
jgi:hypothetical protein